MNRKSVARLKQNADEIWRHFCENSEPDAKLFVTAVEILKVLEKSTRPLSAEEISTILSLNTQTVRQLLRALQSSLAALNVEPSNSDRHRPIVYNGRYRQVKTGRAPNVYWLDRHHRHESGNFS